MLPPRQVVQHSHSPDNTEVGIQCRDNSSILGIPFAHSCLIYGTSASRRALSSKHRYSVGTKAAVPVLVLGSSDL